MGVVPACVLVACDDKQIFSLAVLAFDAHADVEAGDANGDADGPMVIALAQIGFDADADAVGSDASEAGDADADATD